MAQPIRYGLIGYGAWGKHHAEAIRKAPGAELVAICARSSSSVEAATAAYPSAAVSTDYRRLLERNDLDAVDIVLPSHLHHQVAGAALKRGLHVLLEKPMALSIAECDDLISLARQHDRHLVIGHELRQSSLWGTVKELIDDGFIGEPQYVLVELSRNPYRPGADGWRYDIDRVGSWILEEPIHFFDLARWYLESVGTPATVYATANSRQPDHPELQDNFSAIVRMDNGAYAVVTQTLSAFEHHQTAKVTGTRGALWASWSGAIDRTRHPTFSLRAFNGTEVRTVPLATMSGELFELDEEVARFTRLLQGEPATLCTAADGRWSVALCLASQESIRTGTIVSLHPGSH